MARKISIGTWAFGVYSEDPLDFTAVLDRIAALDFDGVELGAFEPHPDPAGCATLEQRAELERMFSERGLKVSAVATGFEDAGFLRDDDNSAYLSAVNRNLDFCAAIGAQRLIVNTGDTPEAPSEVGEEAAYERLITTWREASELAASRGLALTWEFEPCWSFNEPAQVIRIAKELAGPGFGVCYDTAHGHTVAAIGARHVNGPKPLAGGQVEFLDELKGTINHVHLLDSDGTIVDHSDSSEQTTQHVPFGRGEIDFEAVMPALVAAGGDTEWWTVDLCFWPDAWQATEESKRYVDELAATYAP
ncbi:MAG: sugar phosphate isomerase/epimerase [bacterium]